MTPKRPLRSEAEKEKRLSRTQSVITTISNSTLTSNSNGNASKVDNASVSGDSSNSRHSISNKLVKISIILIKNIFTFLVTTDSQTSEEEPIIPPTLPPKHGRDSIEESFYSHARTSSELNFQFSNRPLPATPENQNTSNDNSGHYEVLEIRNREVIQSVEAKMGKKSAPIPPPKPSRSSKNQAMSP